MVKTMKSNLPRALFVGVLTLLQSISVFTWAGGNQWTSIIIPEVGWVSALIIDPFNPNTLYAGTNIGMFKSNDGGEIWSRAGIGPTSTDVVAIVIDPSNSDTLYMGSIGGMTNDSLLNITVGGVFKSTDRGGSWILASNGLPNTPAISSLVIDPSSPNILYAGANLGINSNGGGVYKSSDGGESWSLASNGIPTRMITT
jgi:hypothetical protein